MSRYDLIIIGTGAGGGTLLQRLAPSGKRVLVLERGEWLPREKDNWRPQAVQIEGKYNARETWYDRDGNPFQPGVKYYVGGNTKVWGAATLRLRPSDFGEVHHEGGVSAAWPISYDDLEPYYTQAEQLWRVHGERGVDPFEGQASAPYSHPPVRHEPRVRELVADFAKQGVRAWPLPLALLRNDARPEADACIRCDTCDGYPCLVNGKADAQVICVEPALANSNVTLLTGARATRLETDAPGRLVRRVHVERHGQPETYEADFVAVACGAVNSAALLLRSASERHPRGLANGSGLLGRNYMCHQNSQIFALSRRENRSILQKTFAISDFYRGAREWEFPLGLIQPLNRTPARLLAHQPPGIEGYSPEHLAEHSLEFWLTSEDLARPENRVRLDANGNIVLEYAPNNTEAHRRLVAKLAELLGRIEGDAFDADKHYHAQRMPIGVCSHQCGTARFGPDPRSSVLDVFCRAHELDNLYVVDSSCFPASGAVNPTLTICANALRVGDHLLERMK